MFRCQICKQDFETEKSLHLHVSKKEGMRAAEYYQTFFPRHDMHTGELIKFKNLDFYKTALFNNRDSFVDYCKAHKDNAAALKLLWEMLIALKGVCRYVPSTVEARTTIIPSAALAQSLNIDYNELYEKAGAKRRFDYTKRALSFSTDDEYILIDTREQKPVPFGCKTLVTKLDFGDYTSCSHYKKVFVERKSFADLVGTISGGYERFRRELDRSKEHDSYLVVCVEEDIKALLSQDAFPKQSKAAHYFIAHRIRELMQDYDCVQFLFVGNRARMENIIRKIFTLQDDIRQLDLQWALDLRLL